MPWIEIVPLERAKGFLKKQYDAALGRAGRVWRIVSAMSPNPRVLEASMRMYTAAMHGPSPLSRGRREMLAVVVSAANRCTY
jgi:alkylhydroperoxidase family enzyme